MRKTRSRNEGFPGDHISPVRSHTPVYTVVPASVLAVFSDLIRIASLGAFSYLVMAMPVHWGAFHYMRHAIGAKAITLLRRPLTWLFRWPSRRCDWGRIP